ncbi:MAG: SDR family NAD(P)-dependent oxidoreductase [Chloroflexi bacterium]|nr:SDR family NAD(P)-dependent oxidoreductase [Chloroflexota bacterium]
MNWNGKKVLVTGAGGFIGSNLVEQLASQGAEVTAFLRYNSRNDIGMLRYSEPRLRPQIRFYFGELADHAAVREAMKGQEIVFHLAALIGIPYSYVHPHHVVNTNVVGTLNVLQAANDLGTPRVIHTSTSEVYGTALYAPIDEKHPLQGQSPYSASKIGADKLAESFYLSFGTPVTTVRPFNTYGPRQSARAVIPTIITQALTGDVIKLGSLTPTRDFNYVGDTAAGFMAAAATEATLGEVVNLGTGKEISIGDLVQVVQELLGREYQIVTEDARTRPEKSEVLRLIADNRKAHDLMGWSPQVSIREGLQRTIDWISANLALFNVGQYTV